MNFQKNNHISGTAEDNITKLCTLLESKRPKQYIGLLNLTPKVGVAYDHHHVTTFEISGKPHISGTVKAMIVKFCMLIETKGPRQQTKFDPQSGRGLRSRDHFYNFSETTIFL